MFDHCVKQIADGNKVLICKFQKKHICICEDVPVGGERAYTGNISNLLRHCEQKVIFKVSRYHRCHFMVSTYNHNQATVSIYAKLFYVEKRGGDTDRNGKDSTSSKQISLRITVQFRSPRLQPLQLIHIIPIYNTNLQQLLQHCVPKVDLHISVNSYCKKN
jgi:hypothetical protein